MIRISKDVVKDPPLYIGAKWVEAGSDFPGLSALALGNGNYLSQQGNGTFAQAPHIGKWEAAKLSGQIVAYKSDIASGEIVFVYTWAETP